MGYRNRSLSMMLMLPQKLIRITSRILLIKNPANFVYADTVYDFNSYISPFIKFNGEMLRYGDNRFINYKKMENPSGGNGDSNPWLVATNTANLRGYDIVNVDTYYVRKERLKEKHMKE